MINELKFINPLKVNAPSLYYIYVLANNIVFDPVISGVYERQEKRIRSKDSSIREMEISIFIPYRLFLHLKSGELKAL